MQGTSGYSERYKQLKGVFTASGEDFLVTGTDRACHWIPFHSAGTDQAILEETQPNGRLLLSDEAVSSPNSSFMVPVFMSETKSGLFDPIILLHGLNERSWTKYLVWADYLSEHTGRPVILFPLAFHMNRAPEAWADPRSMAVLVEDRKRRNGNIPLSSFVNVALSERLTSSPLQFLVSGQQSALDILELIRQIKTGSLGNFRAGGTIDFFCYSIGAFLGEILFLADQQEQFGNSRMFLFCGGSLFEDMNGASRMIMDKLAFNTLQNYFLEEIQEDSRRSAALSMLLNHSDMGKAFCAMIATDRLRKFREAGFRALKDRISTITLSADEVITPASVRKAMNSISEVSELDFPYKYTHEAPFPYFTDAQSGVVDRSFEQVFSKAAAFLA